MLCQFLHHRRDRISVLTETSHSIYRISLRACVFISLQSFLTHTFNQAISTHWSQVQAPNTHKKISVLSVSSWPAYTVLLWPTLIESFYRLTGKGHRSSRLDLDTHTHTHSFKEPSAQYIHSHPPGVGESCLWSRQEPRTLSNRCKGKKKKGRKPKLRLVGYAWELGFMWLQVLVAKSKTMTHSR